MTISHSNIEIQSVHSISKTISRELIKDAILAAYEKSNRPYDFDISVILFYFPKLAVLSISAFIVEITSTLF